MKQLEPKYISTSLKFMLILVIGGVSMGIFRFMTHNAQNQKSAIEEYLAQPVSQEVISDLCSRDLIPEQLGDCVGVVPDIRVSDMSIIIRNAVGKAEKYGDIERVLGHYRLGCKDQELSSTTTYGCQYDIDGYQITITYYRWTNFIVRSRWGNP